MIEYFDIDEERSGTSMSNMRSYRPLLAIIFVVACCSRQEVYAAPSIKGIDGYGEIPQHRIRRPNRHVIYSDNHPWENENVYSTVIDQVTTSSDIHYGDLLASSLTTKPDEADVDNSSASVEQMSDSKTRSLSNTDDTISTNSHTNYKNSTDTLFPAMLPLPGGSDYYLAGNSTNSTTVRSNTNHSKPESKQLYHPIRIRASLTPHFSSGSEFLSSQEQHYLLNSIIQPAINMWSKTLSVIPVVGNLTIDTSQLYDEKSCGPGVGSGYASVVVPEEHKEGNTGIHETDLMVYVGVSFYSPLKEKEKEETSKAEDLKKNDLPPKPLVGSDSSTSKDIFEPVYVRGSNVKDDFIHDKHLEGEEIETGSLKDVELEDADCSDSNCTTPSVKPTCTGDYLASATYCNTDQYDRPVAGLIHFCIDEDFFQRKHKDRQIVTAIHEVGHVLGFNIQSMAHFRTKDRGKPLTKRDQHGDVPDVEIECTGIKENRGFSTLPLPSENILKFDTVRNGVRVAQVVTPTVKQIARNHFDCQDLAGAELESEVFHQVANIIDEPLDEPLDEDANSDGIKLQALGECIASHWERRLFKSDLMNPVVDDVPFNSRISPLTLAFFMDSGWYEVDTSRAAHVDSWGRGAGCSFVEHSCLTKTGQVSSANLQFFCNSFPTKRRSNEVFDGCTEDLTQKAMCGIIEYDSALPTEYSYFSNTPTIKSRRHGGDDPDIDYCPLYDGLSHGLCKNIENEIYAKVARLEEFGVSNSRCAFGQIQNVKTSLCVPIACTIADQKLRLRVDGLWKVCDYAGQQLQSWWDKNDFVVCPDPRRVCPTFYCEKNCLGNKHAGACDYDTGECICPSIDDEVRNTTTLLQSEFCTGASNSSAIQVDDFLSVDSSMVEYYFVSANELKDDEKDIFDKTARMFRTLTPGEIVFFTSLSLAAIILFAILISFLVSKLKGQNEQDCISRFMEKNFYFRDAWRSELRREHFFGTGFYGNNTSRNKHKMMASVLVDMRLRDNQPTIVSSSDINPTGYGTDSQEHVIYRSELPPLPGVGRILAIIGAKYIDDAVVPQDNRNDSRSDNDTVSNTVVDVSSKNDSCYTNDSVAPFENSEVESIAEDYFVNEIRRRG